MKGVTVITHPLVQSNLTRLRDQCPVPPEIRCVLHEVATLVIYEATRTFATEPVTVRTPITNLRIFTAAIATRLDERGFIVPGLGEAGDRLFGVNN